MDNFVFLWLLCRADEAILSGLLFLLAWFVCRRIARRPVRRLWCWIGLTFALVGLLFTALELKADFVNHKLWQAANEGNVGDIKHLLDVGASPNPWPADVEGTPLMVAAYKGHADVVRLLLQRGADVNKAREFDYQQNGQVFYSTPLDVAQGRPEIVAILKQAGAR